MRQGRGRLRLVFGIAVGVGVTAASRPASGQARATGQSQPAPASDRTQSAPGAQSTPSPVTPPAGDIAAPVESWANRFDRLWPRREDPKIFEELRAMASREQAKSPADYDANWRLASVFVWEADGQPDGEQKAKVAKQAWDIAHKSVQSRPKQVEGQYYAGAGLGLYSEGVGIVAALAQGLEGKFREYSLAALRIDRTFLDGAPLVLWGRYFYKLPWPKRDVGQSIKVLTNTLAKHPRNLRAKLYLAEALLSDDRKAEAKKHLAEIAAAPDGIDPSEDHRIKGRAAQWAKEHEKDLR